MILSGEIEGGAPLQYVNFLVVTRGDVSVSIVNGTGIWEDPVQRVINGIFTRIVNVCY